MSDGAAFRVALGDRGRLVLPVQVRKRLNLRTGDNLVLTLEPDGSLRLRTVRQVVRETRGLYRAKTPNRSLSEELIAERRKEARRDTSSG